MALNPYTHAISRIVADMNDAVAEISKLLSARDVSRDRIAQVRARAQGLRASLLVSAENLQKVISDITNCPHRKK